MVQQLSALRIVGELDASRYVAGGRQVEAANQSMVQSGRTVNVTFGQTEAGAATASRAMNALSGSVIAGYRDVQRFQTGMRTLARALDQGAISSQHADAVVDGLYRKYGLLANATDLSAAGQHELAASVSRVSASLSQQSGAVQTAIAGQARLATTTQNTSHVAKNLSFQLIDMGQAIPMLFYSPLYAMQNIGFQVAQIGQLYMGQGGFIQALKDAGGLLGQFVVKFAPLAGAVALGYGAFRILTRDTERAALGIDDVTRALGEQAAPLDQVRGQISALQAITDAYARAVRGTAKEQTIASNSIIADSRREFDAKKSLLELELKRQQAAIATRQAELAQTGLDLKREVQGNALVDAGARYQGYADRQVGSFVRLPDDISGVAQVRQAIDNGGYSDKLKQLRADLTLSEIAARGLEDALNTTFDDSVRTSGDRIAKAASKGSSEAEKMAERYSDLVRGANEFIAAQDLERRSYGMTAEAAARLRYEQELLNKAASANIKLTPAQAGELMNYASQMAAAEMRTKSFSAAQSALKDAGQGVGGILKGLTDGTMTFKDALLAAIPVLLKFLNNMNLARGGSGLFGGGFFQGVMQALFGFEKGGAFMGGNVIPFARGGVVDRPTLFPMARGMGLMGEAGPEAVMPLRRAANGSLGVVAAVPGGGALAAGASQQVEVVVRGVFVDDDGVITARIDSSEQRATRGGAQHAVNHVRENFGSWSQQARTYGKVAS